ncbi:MAG: LytTR family transcriptional regulator DNA-binding domain-containing protein [Eubacterium sp.]|nr:LytTR family transcriptional regulator DNA-binding domain-containing protein [Eubacterium sp.]
MKITIESPKQGEEDEIIVRCVSLDERVWKLIQALKTEDKLTGYIEDKIVKLSSKEIYYFETVDNKVFAYTAKETYEIHKKLYEIEQDYEHTDFLRISKSSIVNVSKIAYVKPIFNGRFEAKLKNDEKIVVSRQYVSDLKKKIGI